MNCVFHVHLKIFDFCFASISFSQASFEYVQREEARLQANYLLFLSKFNENTNVLTNFSENCRYQIS